jgi:ABC-type nitrate/sulfonate/bicarbonate transport system permease component
MASDIAVGFAIGLVIGFALGYAVQRGYFLSASSSRKEAARVFLKSALTLC